MKLNDIYKEIITETVGRNKIIDAIKNKRVVTIWYEGDTTEHKGYRTIEPYAYGVNKSGNPVVRAWQRAGVTDTPNGKPNDPLTRMPGWRMFRVDGIKSMKDYGHEKFTTPQEKYNPNDKDMVTVYAAADFGTNPPTGDDMIPTQTPPTSPTAPTEPVNSTPATEPVSAPTGQQQTKQSMFSKWADKFKKLISYNTGYNTKY